jgi:tetratricopeptide (TPR) repeat protein
LEPGNAFTESNLANVYKELGNIYEAEGDGEEALSARKRAADLYARALQTDDRRHEVQMIWLNFGGIFIDAGYYDHATHYLTNFLKAYPLDPRGNYWMGFCLVELGEYEKAIPFLEQAVRGKPTVEAWSILALSYGNAGQIEKAIDGYSRILAATPDSSGIHYQLGLLYRRVGEARKALSHLNRALSLEPDGEHSVHIRRLLGSNGGGS